MFRDGFYTALGTPLDDSGNVIESSLRKHIADQIGAGASGLLLLGSMGYEPCVRDDAYAQTIRIGAAEANGKCPLFAGVMDNSVGRVLDRIKAAGDAKLDGVVVTTPFYFMCTPAEIKNYFSMIAKTSKYPVFLYDLPAVTKLKITLDIVLDAMKEPNIKGIKTGDIVLARELANHPDRREDFTVFFSGLDIFDVAYEYGIKKNLDGMFACTPVNTMAMYRCFSSGDIAGGGKYLNNILAMRQVFIEFGVLTTFSVAMNLLGYSGKFHADYGLTVSGAAAEKVAAKLKEIGE
jgi:4-hydroxy-tetrahydrodipicolinate synthase